MPPPAGQRYNISVFQVMPRANRVVVETSSGIVPGPRANHKIYNIGRVPIIAEAKYGTAVTWIGVVDKKTVKPGEVEILSFQNRPYFVTGIQLTNNDSYRALVHVGLEGDRYPWYDTLEPNWKLNIDINELAKTLVVFGVGFIPDAGPFLALVIDFFWPENSPNVWDQMKDKVSHLVDSKTNEVIRGILGGDIRYFKERIIALKRDMERGQDVSSHYMNIAEDLIGFEEKFIFNTQDNSRADEINYVILPMFSSLVTLKLTFYQFGIINREKIGLSAEHIERLKDYIYRLVDGPDGALKHVNRVYNERLEHELNTCNPDHVHDALVTVRTYCGMNGLEYIPYWKQIMERPEFVGKPYNLVLTYSTGFGRPTPSQARQQIVEKLHPPLQPKLTDGKRHVMTAVDVWIWRGKDGNGTPVIGGLKVYFGEDETYSMGRWSGNRQWIYFKGAKCIRLTVWGDKGLDALEFAFSDGRVISHGTKTSIHRDFELAKHHIAGIYVGADFAELGGQAANISVSFQLTHVD
nr:uncharacterized protein LOC111517505 [Leptinotarsa decemlineata]